MGAASGGVTGGGRRRHSRKPVMAEINVTPIVGKPAPPQPPAEFFADVISDAELSQITKGARDAKQAPEPKPLVEKVAEAKPTENPLSKVSEKPEVIPTAELQQPKPEEPKKA